MICSTVPNYTNWFCIKCGKLYPISRNIILSRMRGGEGGGSGQKRNVSGRKWSEKGETGVEYR